MLDQYEGVLQCEVNYNDGDFAECDVVDAHTTRPSVSIDDEFWVDYDAVQIHPDRLGITSQEFMEEYPVGKEFFMELIVRVIPEDRAMAKLRPRKRLRNSGPNRQGPKKSPNSKHS